MTEMELRLAAALTAAKWLGTKEGTREHRQLLAVYNGIRPLPRGYSMKEKDPWCAAFVSAAAEEAGVGALYPLECGCGKLISKAQSMGIWVENDAHIPLIGDWILYNWQAAPEGDDTGGADHVGIVAGIRDGTLAVIEGNYDNSVKLRRLTVNDRNIRGYVCPDFGSIAQEVEELRYHTIAEVPAYARETIEKLIKDGSLRGISEEDLGLSEELVRILVILDRSGIFRT